ncbi:hypothetical protein, partial [Dysosmobacter sp.]|uniref:hypothetical protein n=1 Tax=Dysosmobacter sp. TaxID=2591382 RepID=UPI003AB8578E
PVGQQEIHEHEALGGGHGRCLYCRLTSFSRSLQTILRINLDGTGNAPTLPDMRDKQFDSHTLYLLSKNIKS